VVICLQPKEEIGNEMHSKVDRFSRIQEGKARFIINGKEKHLVSDGDTGVARAGTYHNVINISAAIPLKLFIVHTSTTPGWDRT
jgi:mannose-6-phosphate isomerase-like protein (cupin superfamily)